MAFDTPPPAPHDAERERRPDQQTIQDLTLLVERLVRALRQVAPDHPLPALASDFLQRRQLPGPPLREIDEAALARLTERGAAAWRDVPDAGAWVDALRGGPDVLSRLEVGAPERVASKGVPR